MGNFGFLCISLGFFGFSGSFGHALDLLDMLHKVVK